jgi:hypothetical protein
LTQVDISFGKHRKPQRVFAVVRRPIQMYVPILAALFIVVAENKGTQGTALGMVPSYNDNNL